MSDYGFRISADGVDVKTGGDKDMVVTSKYSMLKGSLSGSGTVSVPRDASEVTVTIAHGLPNIPIVQAFVNDDVGMIINQDYYYPVPQFFFDGITILAVKAKADATNVYLIFSIEDL